MLCGNAPCLGARTFPDAEQKKPVVGRYVTIDVKGESEAIWLEKWCPQHAGNGAVIKLSEALVAGGINVSGLKQDRCEGQHGRNPERRHLYAGRLFVAGYLVRLLQVTL